MKRLAVCFGMVACGMAAWADGTIDMASLRSGEGWTVSGGVATITANGNYTLTGTTTSNRVVVGAGVTAMVTLQNVNISSATASPLELNSAGCAVRLRLVGNNTLACSITSDIGEYYAALQVEGSANITIEGNGSLTATGGYAAAAIGSRYVGNDNGHISGVIHIKNGNLTLTGGRLGAGIGGGAWGNAGNISITGGNVSVTGGEEAAGIGGGAMAGGGSISISGGVVLAVSGIQTSGGGGAGIGGGAQGSAGTVSITGGSIFAYGRGISGGIGGGYGKTDGRITISGGTVTANRIGVVIYGNNAGSTPTTLTGGAILTDAINATDFGRAQVLTGVSLSLEMMRAMAANTSIRTTETYDTTIVTLGGDTTLLHETVRLETRDTLWLGSVHTRDTVRIELHDTFERWTDLQVDTFYLPRPTDDTLYIYRYMHDTVEAPVTGWRDTTEIIVHDTLRLPAIERHYIVVAHDAAGVAYETEAFVYPYGVTIGSDGSATLSSLAPQTAYTLYDFPGRVIARGQTDAAGRVVVPASAFVPQTSRGYILWNSGRYWEWEYGQ